MVRQRIIEQVNGILKMRGIESRSVAGEDDLLVEFADGSSGLEIKFSELGARTVITLSAIVLIGVRIEGERRSAILERLNQLNCDTRFGRFVLDDLRETIRLDYDILGDDLDTHELAIPLETIAHVADDLDDRLVLEVGCGHRVADLKALIQEGSAGD